jgi:hypothetical protein
VFEIPLTSHRPVMVGVDGSPAADLAASVAFDEAANRSVALTAVRAWQPPRPPRHIDVRPLILDMDELGTAEWTMLTESIAVWRSKYPQVSVEARLMPGSAGTALVNASRDAQLAVVGTCAWFVLGKEDRPALAAGSACQLRSRVVQPRRCPAARFTSPTQHTTPTWCCLSRYPEDRL